MKIPKPSFIALTSAIAVHGFFSIQAIAAAHSGGMLRDDIPYFLFYPHLLLIYFLPPNYPIQTAAGGHVTIDWLRFIGKLADAIPASLLYGFFIAFIYAWITHKKEDGA